MMCRQFINKRTIIAISIVLLSLSGNAIAQDTLRINLNQALEIALSEGASIKIADLELKRTKYYKNEMLGGFYPTISGSANYSRNIDPQVIFLPEGIFGPGSGGPMQMGSDNSYTAGLSVSLPLFAPALFKMLEVSNADIEIALEKSRASKLNMVSEVKKAFYSHLLARSSYEVLQMSVLNAQKNLENSRNFYKQGIVAEYDVIRADVQVRNLNPYLIQAESALNLSAIKLKILLGIDVNIEIVAEEKLVDFESDYINFKPLANFSVDNNTNIIQLELQEFKLNKQHQLLKTNRLPTLAAFGNYQYQSQANNFNFSEYNWVKSTMVGLQLQIPIFQGFAKKYREQQVLVGIDLLRVQRDDINKNLTLMAQNATSNMLRASEQINLNKEGIALAERGYNIAQTRYRTGTGTIFELNDSEDALRQAKQNYNQSLFDYLQAKVEYETIIGESTL
jgi:outer membrane protein TolC